MSKQHISIDQSDNGGFVVSINKYRGNERVLVAKDAEELHQIIKEVAHPLDEKKPRPQDAQEGFYSKTLPPVIQAIAQQIGEFYLEKNGGHYDDAHGEIESLQIRNIETTTEGITITTNRPGLLIGKWGENISNLEKELGAKIHVVECADDLSNWLAPPRKLDPLDEYYENLHDHSAGLGDE